MALVLGTNCGFVSAAPVGDPDASSGQQMDDKCWGLKDTTPATAARITEIGWYQSNTSEEANMEVGIYTNNVGDAEPEAVVGALSQTNAKGTGGGEWKRVTGLNITIDPSTIYWIAVQVDDTATITLIDSGGATESKYNRLDGATTLPSPWGASDASIAGLIAIYAVWDTEAPYEYEPVYTKIEVEGTAYEDVPKITVDRTIGEFSATSNFTAEFNNFNGQYSDTFNLNDEVVIYADRGTNPPTTKIFTGIIEDINFKGDVEKEKVKIVGRDYSAVMMDMTVQPVIYKNEDAGVIARQVMLNNTGELLTANNMDTSTGTTIERIGFNHINVFSALQELAELSSYYFYVDTDKDVHFEAKSSTSSGQTFDNTNVKSAVFKKDDREIYNKIFVYGARVLTGANDTFATEGGAVTGSVFTLNSKPHNTRVTSHDVLQQPGGIYEMTNPATETDLKYLVDFNEQKIIFVSGTAAGENIPASGTSPISVDYERFTPLLKYKTDDTSVTNYGPKTKIIKDDNLKSFSEVNERATTFLADNKDPKIQGDIDVKGVLDMTPGNTCVVDLPWHGISSQTYTILSASYNFNKLRNRADDVLHITVNKKLSDFTDVMKEQMIKLKQFEVGPLEGEYTNLLSATRYADVDSHYELWQKDINENFVFHSEKHSKIHDPNSRLGTGVLGSTFIVSGGGF